MTTLQTVTSTLAIERMLEAVDHWTERHRETPAHLAPTYPTPHLPAGWILYSACYKTTRAKKGWNVALLGTSGPFRKNSIVGGWSRHSLDDALLDASRKITKPV